MVPYPNMPHTLDGRPRRFEVRPSNRPTIHVVGRCVADLVAPLPAHDHVLVYQAGDMWCAEVRTRTNGRALILAAVGSDPRELEAWLVERCGETGREAALLAGLTAAGR